MNLVCETSGGRLDAWLAAVDGSFTRSGAQKLIASGLVNVNGAAAAKNYKVKAGDRIEYQHPKTPAGEIAAQDIKLDIIYEDGQIIVVDKPAGMVVHPGGGVYEGTLANALAHHCAGALSDAGGASRPGIVHRLDKDTSGLIVAAKTNEAHHKLSAEFKGRRVIKIYNAIVCGHIEHDSGRIEMPIGRHKTDRKRMGVPDEGGRNAVTLFRAVKRLPCGYTWLELDLLTGRTHQIRVHLAEIGHPVAGDPVYGRGKRTGVCPYINDPDKRRSACILNHTGGGQLLHSTILEFTHPATGGRLRLESRLPAYFPNGYK